MAALDNVPVIEVNKDNLADIWPTMVQAIKESTFIALDTELSGLGDRKLLNAKSIDDRYGYMCEVARSRSIVALGVSCYRLASHSLPSSSPGPDGMVDAQLGKRQAKRLDFEVQSYNLLFLCSEDYVVEPLSLKFLAEHGFDFNKQYGTGLPYYRGNDKKDEDTEGPTVRQLFAKLIEYSKPIVLHNALVDLVFLYANLYANLPASNTTFTTDLAEMFPEGIYDSKYITDFKVRMGASYLEYVFKKCQKENLVSSEKGWSHTHLGFSEIPAEVAKYSVNVVCTPSELQADTGMDMLCMQYANHGWCPSGAKCLKSHNIDHILYTQDQAVTKKHKKHHPESSTDNGSGVDSSHKDDSTDASQTGATLDFQSWEGSHRAGFDAFMTGYIFAFFSARYGKPPDGEVTGVKRLGLTEFQNKVYLVGKDIPLQITKSSFSKSSKDHRSKLQKIRKL